MSIRTDASSLSADALEAFLDDTEATLEQQLESGLAPSVIQNNLRSAMQRHQYRADTLHSVRRLANLWSRAGEPDAALAVLDGDGRALLAAVSRDAYEDTHLTLALTRVEVLGDHPARALPAAEEAYALLASLGHDAGLHKAWDYLGSLAGRAGLFDMERRCAEGRHAYQCAQPARAPYRAFDKALTALWRGHSYAREGAGAQAQAAAAEAIAVFQDAGPEQDLNVNDWLYLGDSLATLLPERVATVLERVQLLAATAAAPRRRDIAIRAARLQARALYRQGALPQAIEAARGGRYALTGDDDDAFSALVLDWLLEAGQHSQAAALAFESVFNERVVSSDHACSVALAQLSDDTTGSGSRASSAYWPLALAWASTVEATAWVVGEQDPADFFRAHLQLARAVGAALPAIDAVEGLYLVEHAQDYAAALPLLESAARDPGLATSQVVPKLWLCRMWLHGVERALQMPFVDVACAGWCYNTGVILQTDTRDRLAPGSAWPEAEVNALVARYYERGAALFEHFFATGQGMYRDADVHAYSMLCNNLAICYRFDRDDYQGALALHHKGIEASPFAEHYDGIMRCLFGLKDEAGAIDAADQLWRFSAEYGYSRHKPFSYINDVAGCLHRQGRGLEIPVWVRRLDEWWESLDESERAEEAEDYWDALSVTLCFMGYTREAEALARLDAALPELGAAGSILGLRMAADSLSRAGQHERALALYRQALDRFDPDREWQVQQKTYAQESLEECEKELRASRPWWRFWK